MTDNQRSQDRKGVALLVQLKHPDVGTFAEQWATNLSPGGMFVRTRKPQAVGTQLRFEVKIAEGVRVMRGVAMVRWVRGENDPAGPAGMGLQFSALDAETRALVDRMLARPASKAGAGTPPPASPVPPAPLVAPLSLVAPVIAPVVAPTIAPVIAPVIPPVAPSIPAAFTPPPAAFTPPPAAFTPPPGGLPSIAPVVPSIAPSIAPVVAPLAPPILTPLPFDIAEAPPEPASDVVDLPLEELIADVPPIADGAPIELDEPLSMDGFELSFDDEPIEVAPAVDPGPPAISPMDLLPEPFELEEAAIEPPVEPFELEELDLELAPEPESEPVLGLPTPFPEPAQRPPPPPAPVAKAPVAPPALPGRRRILFLEPPASIPDDGPVLGIDLGTSNSCVAYTREGKPTVIRSRDGYNTVPSVVSLTDKGKLFVGHRARSQLVMHPQHTILGAKRMVGRRFDNAVVKQVREHFHYEVSPDAEGTAAVRLRGQVVSLSEIQGLVLRECKQMAEEHFGRPVHRAVVTVPAYYSEPQREAVREAGRLAGLRVERILNEPTAAALAYGLNRQLTRRILVYDLGGGTFDATALKVDANVFEVLATGGDTFLGGVDFDNAVVDALLQRFEQQEGIAFSGDGVALSRVAEAAEQAKMALSERTSYDIELPMLMMDSAGQPRSMRLSLTRDELNTICRPLVERSLDVVRDVLLDARLRATDIEDVILVGGQSRMPLVRESLKAMFGKAPHAAVNADEAVALGAALYAGTLEKVSNVVLIDVLPMTVGLGLPGGQFRRLIERNTPLPAQHGFTVGTGRDGERAIELHLFQGEDAHVGGNEYLGTVRIEGIPPGPRGKEQIAVSLRLDTECVLHVDARHANGQAPLEVSLSARYDASQLQRLLGYGEEATRVDAARAEELTSRAGRFWNRLKKAIGR